MDVKQILFPGPHPWPSFDYILRQDVTKLCRLVLKLLWSSGYLWTWHPPASVSSIAGIIDLHPSKYLLNECMT